MPRPRDVESVIADYLGQFGVQDPGPGPEAAGLIRWLADEGWTLVTAGREPESGSMPPRGGER